MMTESLAYPGDTRRLSVGEEVLNAVSHGVGALLAVAGTVFAGPACQGLWGPGQPGGRHGVWGVHDPPLPLFLLVPCLAAVEGEAGVSSIGPLLHFPADYGDLCPRLSGHCGRPLWLDLVWHQPGLWSGGHCPQCGGPGPVEETLLGALPGHGVDGRVGHADDAAQSQ